MVYNPPIPGGAEGMGTTGTQCPSLSTRPLPKVPALVERTPVGVRGADGEEVAIRSEVLSVRVGTAREH